MLEGLQSTFNRDVVGSSPTPYIRLERVYSVGVAQLVERQGKPLTSLTLASLFFNHVVEG